MNSLYNKVLYVAVSFHGFGHIAQTAPVVNELVRRHPEIQVILRCAAPLEILQKHFHCEFDHIPEAMDFGMRMTGALDVQAEASHAAYRDFHSNWEEKVQQAAEHLRKVQADIVLANIPYLILEAAERAGIPSVALCSLNWADIYQGYCGRMEGSQPIREQMIHAYQQAKVFMLPEPSMEMPDLQNTRAVGVIGRIGRDRREELHKVLNIPPDERLVLLSLGGTNTNLDLHKWSELQGIHLLVKKEWAIERKKIHAIEVLDMSFVDLIRSCDAFVIKPGYGSFAEAVCNGIPVIYTRRLDWPEEPYLVEWLQQNAVCEEVTREQLVNGDIQVALEKVWSVDRKGLQEPGGIDEAVGVLEDILAD